MDSRPYDVVLLPEESIAQKAVAISEQCKPHGTHFTLNQQDCFAHLSLYMLQLNEAGLAASIKILRSIAENTKAMELSFSHYNYENRYLDVEYVKSDELAVLQEKILAALNPLRDGLRKKDQERIKTAKGAELLHLQTYGYRSIGTEFFPHVTFTRFIGEEPDVLATFPAGESFSGAYTSLALFEMGDNGTCIKRIGSWSLYNFPSLALG